MKCEHCNVNIASIELSQILEGEKKTVHLCEACAQKLKPSSPLITNGLMTGLLDTINNSGLKVNYIMTTACTKCGMTYGRFKESGELGCDACYEAFEEKLRPLIKRVQGSERHSGKMPVRYSGAVHIRREITRLKGRLDYAVRREAFEEAAILRDRIKSLEDSLQD